MVFPALNIQDIGGRAPLSGRDVFEVAMRITQTILAGEPGGGPLESSQPFKSYLMNRYQTYCLWLIFSLLVSQPLAAQEKKNAVYAEAGPGISTASGNILPVIKLCYEREFRLPPKGLIAAWGFRAGISTFWFPVNVLVKTGRAYHHAELQAGANVIYTGNNGYVFPVIPLPLLQVGYRYEPPQGGLVLKASVGLDFPVATTGVGIGWAF